MATPTAPSTRRKLRFVGYGWRVIEVGDGNDLGAIDRAFAEAASHSDRPTLIRLRTIIGYPAPTRQGTAKAHGEALGKEEVARTKEILGWPAEPAFYIPPEVAAERETIVKRGAELRAEWERRLENYRAEYPNLAREFDDALAGRLSVNWTKCFPRFPPGPHPPPSGLGAALQALVTPVPTWPAAPPTSREARGRFSKG